MSKRLHLPEISEHERTPLVDGLLAIIEELSETVRHLEEENGRLKDEILVLKGEKSRPKFKPSRMEKDTEQAADSEQEGEEEKKRPGSQKRSKTQDLVIHHEQVISPKVIPEDSRFKGYEDYVVQDLKVEADNTRYRLECWQTPEGEMIRGELPASVHGHYGAQLRATVLYLHHHGRVTQPLLLEMLQEWGIDISAGQVDALLTGRHEEIRQEKDEILRVGLDVSAAVTVDDTGNRHQGKNGYTTHIGNEYFAWFASTQHKSRLNFLCLLRAGETDWEITQEGLDYMKQQGLPQKWILQLQEHPIKHFPDENTWKAHLSALGIQGERHERIASEGAQVGCLLKNDLWKRLVIVSDDAGQFAVPLLTHALCWVHTERLVHKLIPLNEPHRQAQATVRGQIWDFYKDLKQYAIAPDEAKKAELSARFDAIFIQKTEFASLNQVLKRLHRNKAELLQVLEHPQTPLHTNGSERDIREQVIRKKISGGTRSDLGRRCRDTFLSVKKTCRKLGVSFWRYLLDRTAGTHAVPPLPVLIRQRAEAAARDY
jgi:hypothetical protein